MRKTLLTLLVLCAGSTSAPAQGWAEKMFPDGISHDFGNVPRGAQLCHKFTITNIYAVRMEITGINSGCGCVTATAGKRVLEPRESTVLEVNMDARRFTGSKTVAVRVSVGPEYTSTADIKVTANSRSDIVFNPGEVSFGTVTRGQATTQTIDVEYAGTQNWQVSGVEIKDAPLEATVKETYRRPGQIGYQIKVSLKPDAPVGALKQEIFLKTNDQASPLVPLVVEATVQSAVTVTPSAVNLGAVKTNETLTRRVLVKGNKPFRVLKVEGLGGGIELAAAPGEKAEVVQTLTFKCTFTQAGDFKREIKIKTDLEEAPVVVTIDGNATP
jgi:hypothetical protein